MKTSPPKKEQKDIAFSFRMFNVNLHWSPQKEPVANKTTSKFLTFKLKASCYFFLLFLFSFFVGNDQWLYGTFHRHPVIPFVNLQIWKYSKTFLIISIYEPSMFRILKGFINVKPRVFRARIKFSFYIRFFSGLF